MIPWPSHAGQRPPPILPGARGLRRGRVEREARRGVAARLGLGERRRRACASRPRRRGTSPGPSAASARSATDRPRARACTTLCPLSAVVLARLGRDEPERAAERRVEDVPHERRSCPSRSRRRRRTCARPARGSRRRCRLCARAPESSIHASAMGRFGRSTRAVSSSARAVGERGSTSTCAAGPSATTWPPLRPPPGPRSMTWSAARIVSASCSTTSTVEPMSASCAQVREEPPRVARVQADGRLVEHVERAGQAAPELRAEAQALHLAARERRSPRDRARGSRGRPARRTRAAAASSACGPFAIERVAIGEAPRLDARERARHRAGRASARTSRRTCARRAGRRSRRDPRAGRARLVRRLVLLDRRRAALDAGALARLAPALLRVEREPPRVELGDAGPAAAGTRASVESICSSSSAPGARGRSLRRRAPRRRPTRARDRTSRDRGPRACRSTTMRSIVCSFVLASFGGGSIATIAPSTRAACTPAREAVVKRSRYVPLRARTAGA